MLLFLFNVNAQLRDMLEKGLGFRADPSSSFPLPS